MSNAFLKIFLFIYNIFVLFIMMDYKCGMENCFFFPFLYELHEIDDKQNVLILDFL